MGGYPNIILKNKELDEQKSKNRINGKKYANIYLA
jgi:hypothetical protein